MCSPGFEAYRQLGTGVGSLQSHVWELHAGALLQHAPCCTWLVIHHVNVEQLLMHTPSWPVLTVAGTYCLFFEWECSAENLPGCTADHESLDCSYSFAKGAGPQPKVGSERERKQYRQWK